MLIVLSGPTGSGKSSTALLLKKKILRPALVELDSIRDFILEVHHDKAFPIVVDMAILVTRRLLAEGYNVIFVYLLPDRTFKKISQSLRRWPIRSFVLSPEQKAIGRGRRKLIPWEKRRVLMQYRIGLHQPKFGVKIDTTKMKPAEVVQEVVMHLPKSILRK